MPVITVVERAAEVAPVAQGIDYSAPYLAAWIGAGATLVAGLAAVIGAVIVGTRQAAILHRQIVLQELTIKETLFERRFNYYSLPLAFGQKVKMRGEKMAVREQAINEFVAATRKSVFFFPAELGEQIDELITLGVALSDSTEDFESDIDDTDREVLRAARSRLRREISEATQALQRALEPHLRLA